MRTRIERRRAQVGRWVLYPLIALSATALAGLAIASPPASTHTADRVLPVPAAASGLIHAPGRAASSDGIGAGAQGRASR